MKRTIFIVLSLLILLGSYLLNNRLQIIAWNSLHVTVKDDLSIDRVLIKRGAYTINRKSDLALFENADCDTIFFEGGTKKSWKPTTERTIF